MPLSKNCLFCNKAFLAYRRFDKVKYCSSSCFHNHSKTTMLGKNNPFYGKKHTKKTKEKLSQKLKGRPSNSGTFRKNGRILMGKNHPLWKGEDISYSGLHKWLYRKFGSPDTCEHCKKSGLRGRAIHWANKSGKYSRNRKDWLRLCRLCHEKHDKRVL